MSIEQYLAPAAPRANPCIDCACPIRRCPWLHADKPVPGWTAARVSIRLAVDHGRPHWVETYRITACPLFRPAPPRKSSRTQLAKGQFLRSAKGGSDGRK